MNLIPHIDRVCLRHYKSIARCDVRLRPLTVLAGPNGSGKSNFLDALALLAEALETSLGHALSTRGGLPAVRRRGTPDAEPIEIAVELVASAEAAASYVLALAPDGVRVQREELVVFQGATSSGASSPVACYRVEDGQVALWKGASAPPPAAAADRLFLVRASGEPVFRAVFDALSQMRFHHLDPARIRLRHEPDAGHVLAPDAGNLISVVRRLSVEAPAVRERIENFLRGVLPELRGLETSQVDGLETLRLVLDVGGKEERFPLAGTSDGTVQALAVLVALFTPARSGASQVTLVGLEEPEKAIHPAATGVLADALREASERVQVLVTTHSPDLLEHDAITVGDVVAVTATGGESALGTPDAFARSALADRLSTLGELLRLRQLRPEPAAGSG